MSIINESFNEEGCESSRLGQSPFKITDCEIEIGDED